MSTPCLCPAPPRWIHFDDDGRIVWLSLAHVRQVLFTAEHGEPCALVWSGGDLWEIGDPVTIDALRRFVTGLGEGAAGGDPSERIAR